MISGSEPANLAVVANRVVNGALFRTAPGPMPAPASTEIQVLKPAADLASLTPAGTLSLRTPHPAVQPVRRPPSRENPPVSRPAEPLPALREPSDSRSY